MCLEGKGKFTEEGKKAKGKVGKRFKGQGGVGEKVVDEKGKVGENGRAKVTVSKFCATKLWVFLRFSFPFLTQSLPFVFLPRFFPRPIGIAKFVLHVG